MKHGTRWCFMQGCKNLECKVADSKYTKELRARRKQALINDPTLKEHGKPSTYINWGCRCYRCRTAHSAWQADQRRKKSGGDGI